MSNGKTEQEPPMEEILASIRRIISENVDPEEQTQEKVEPDESAQEKAEPDEPAQERPGDGAGDVLELTQMIKEDGSMVDLTKDESEPGVGTDADPQTEPSSDAESGLELAVDLQSDPDDSAAQPEPAEEPEPAAAPEPAADDERLVSAAAAEAAMNPQADHARAADPEPTRAKGLSFRDSGTTVEQLVIELMRPMLREWLDDNLPNMVERLVQREIRHLIRRSETD